MPSCLTPKQQALKEAYSAACELLPVHLRRSAILIGGAASIVHGMTDRDSEDADLLVSHEALVTLYNAISRRQGGFRVDFDEITLSQRDHLGNHEFFVRVELIQLNGPFAPRIPSIVGFGDGWVATLPELVRFRCETLVARGDEVDYYDLRRLLPMMNRRGLQLPHIGEEELGIMIEAVEMLEDGELEGLFISILSSFEDPTGRRWENWVDFMLNYGG